MKTSNSSKTLQWIRNKYKRGLISFKHKLQRPIDQWGKLKKSKLIHTLLVGYPVNPIYVTEENDVIYPLDGSQRVSTCIEYLNDGFRLSKETPQVQIKNIVDEQEVITTYDIAGKKFSQLDEELQEILLSASLTFCTMSEYNSNELKEVFDRLNSGKALNGKQLRVCYMSDELADVIFELASHPFMDKVITKAQYKNGSDRDAIIQAFMLICTNKDNDYTSFLQKDINDFVINHEAEITEKVPVFKEALNNLDKAFDGELKIRIINLPMILYSAYRVTKDKKSFYKLAEIIVDFNMNYENNEEFKQFTGSGTSSSQMVRGRFDWWRAQIKAMQ